MSEWKFQFTGLIRGPTRQAFSSSPYTPFQFTGLIRGPTITDKSIRRSNRSFNSQASYEARPKMVRPRVIMLEFQFTGLIRGPTWKYLPSFFPASVSIHRPHTRPDSRIWNTAGIIMGFNSQASYEARPFYHSLAWAKLRFQFTGLIRGPTNGYCKRKPYQIVSIHRPHTRPDQVQWQGIIREVFQFTGLIRGPTFRRGC